MPDVKADPFSIGYHLKGQEVMKHGRTDPLLPCVATNSYLIMHWQLQGTKHNKPASWAVLVQLSGQKSILQEMTRGGTVNKGHFVLNSLILWF